MLASALPQLPNLRKLYVDLDEVGIRPGLRGMGCEDVASFVVADGRDEHVARLCGGLAQACPKSKATEPGELASAWSFLSALKTIWKLVGNLTATILNAERSH